MKKTLYLILALFACSIQTNAQDYNLNTFEYIWNEKPVNFTPDSIEKTYPGVFVLYKKIIDHRFSDKTKMLEQYVVNHTIKFINDDKSIEENNKLYIPVRETQNLLKIMTRVIKNGNVVSSANEKDFTQVTEDGQQYNIIAIKGLEKGTIIETITALRIDNFDLYGDIYFQFSTPVKQAEFYLITPGHLEFKCKSYNKFAPITDSIVNGRHVYYGNTKNIIAIDNDEKYSLANANKHRVEYVYHMNTDSRKVYAKWPELGRIFFDRIYEDYDKNDKELSKILGKIKFESGKTELEKIWLIENYLKTNLSIDDDMRWESAKTFSDILKKKVTTPYMFNQILAQLYRKAGLNMEIVLTCKKDYKRFDPEFDSWSYLRNVLFYFPSIKKYIDPQEPFKRLGSIGGNFLGQHGLFIKYVQIGDAVSATASVKQIPANDPVQTNDIERYTMHLTDQLNEAIIDYKREMQTYAEQGIKSWYFVYNETDKKEFIENFIKGFAKEAKVEQIKVENYHPDDFNTYDKPLIITANVKTDHYIEAAGTDKYLIKVGELIGQQAEMYQDKKRINPADIDYAHTYDRELVIVIPEGYQVKGAEKFRYSYTYTNANKQPSFGFVSDYKIEGNKLIITCKEYYYDLTYPAEIFDDYKKVINAAADFNKISVLIEKK